MSYESVHLDSFDHNLVESNVSSSICVFPIRRRSGKSPSSLDPRRRTAAGIGRRSSYVLRLSSSTHTKKLTMVRSCEAFALHQSISVTLSSHKMTGKGSIRCRISWQSVTTKLVGNAKPSDGGCNRLDDSPWFNYSLALTLAQFYPRCF